MIRMWIRRNWFKIKVWRFFFSASLWHGDQGRTVTMDWTYDDYNPGRYDQPDLTSEAEDRLLRAIFGDKVPPP